jgi:hypothetical protein
MNRELSGNLTVGLYGSYRLSYFKIRIYGELCSNVLENMGVINLFQILNKIKCCYESIVFLIVHVKYVVFTFFYIGVKH